MPCHGILHHTHQIIHMIIILLQDHTCRWIDVRIHTHTHIHVDHSVVSTLFTQAVANQERIFCIVSKCLCEDFGLGWRTEGVLTVDHEALVGPYPQTPVHTRILYKYFIDLSDFLHLKIHFTIVLSVSLTFSATLIRGIAMQWQP